MISEISLRYFKALSTAIGKESKTTIKEDIGRVLGAYSNEKFRYSVQDPFKSLQFKIKQFKELQLMNEISNCIEQMLRNSRYMYIEELFKLLSQEFKGSKSQLIITLAKVI